MENQVKDNQGNGFYDFFNLLGNLAAFVTIVVYLLLIINANWSFIPEGEFYNILNIAKVYAPLITVLVVGMEVASTREFIVRLILYVAIAAIIIFQFFPGTWENFIGTINNV